MLSWMLANRVAWQQSLDTISTSNVDRHNAAQGYVGGIYFMLSLMVLQIMAIGTLWMNWLWQPLKTNETVPAGTMFEGDSSLPPT